MTARWLIPVDGSEASLHAVDFAIAEARQLSALPEILLLNVQAPLSKDISRFIAADTLREFHDENGEQALKDARARLDEAGIPYVYRVLLGEAAASILDTATSQSCSRIIMGTRGLGSVVGMLIGSVTTKVVHQANVPVVLVK